MEQRRMFAFYRSFLTAAELLETPEEQAAFLIAVCRYALDGAEPKGLSGAPRAMFALTRPNLDAARRRAGWAVKEPEGALSRKAARDREEHEGLVREFGPEDAKRIVEMMAEYESAAGTHGGDKQAVRAWCAERLREEKRAAGRSFRALAAEAGRGR